MVQVLHYNNTSQIISPERNVLMWISNHTTWCQPSDFSTLHWEFLHNTYMAKQLHKKERDQLLRLLISKCTSGSKIALCHISMSWNSLLQAFGAKGGGGEDERRHEKPGSSKVIEPSIMIWLASKAPNGLMDKVSGRSRQVSGRPSWKMLKKTADLVKRDIPKSEDRRPYSTRHKPINSKSWVHPLSVYDIMRKLSLCQENRGRWRCFLPAARVKDILIYPFES